MGSGVQRQRKRDKAFVRRASPVTVTKADGTVEVHKPYSVDEVRRIDRKAAMQPRIWDEINSRGGGGADRNFT